MLWQTWDNKWEFTRSPISVTLVPRVITRFICCAVPGQQKEGKANRMAENKAKAGNTWFMEKERKENS